jgi:hypothetical protein
MIMLFLLLLKLPLQLLLVVGFSTALGQLFCWRSYLLSFGAAVLLAVFAGLCCCFAATSLLSLQALPLMP